MKIDLKNSLVKGVIFFVLCLLAFYIYNLLGKVKEAEEQVDSYQELVIERDITIKESEGLYSKLSVEVDSYKTLIDSLRVYNSELAEDIKSKPKVKPVLITQMKIIPYGVIDTVQIIKTEYSPTFKASYPKQGESFVNVTGTVNKDSVVVDWRFNPIKTSFVVSEISKGIYKLTAGVPDWLDVKDVKVYNIKRIIERQSTSRLKVGGVVGVSYSGGLIPELGLTGGFNINDYSVLVNVTNKLRPSIMLNKNIKW